MLQIKAVALIEPHDETHGESLQQPEFAKKVKHTHTNTHKKICLLWLVDWNIRDVMGHELT